MISHTFVGSYDCIDRMQQGSFKPLGCPSRRSRVSWGFSDRLTHKTKDWQKFGLINKTNENKDKQRHNKLIKCQSHTHTDSVFGLFRNSLFKNTLMTEITFTNQNPLLSNVNFEVLRSSILDFVILEKINWLFTPQVFKFEINHILA